MTVKSRARRSYALFEQGPCRLARTLEDLHRLLVRKPLHSHAVLTNAREMMQVSIKQAHWPLVRIVLAGVLLSSCAATEKSLPIPYAISFEVTPDVNPDGNARPSPIVLQIFRLKSAAGFDGADFFSLQSKTQSTLAGELLGVDRLILRPGESRTVRYTGDLDARNIGVVAGYRALERNRWKLIVPLPAAKETNLLKFWQTSPGEIRLTIAVKNGGVQIVDQTEANR
jgi:type VI secretion system protein VasD